VKGKPDALKDVSIEAQLQKESLTTHFNGQGKRTVFDIAFSANSDAGKTIARRP
jgi:hypothetical protein